VNIVATAAVAVAGGALFERMNVPAGAMVGAMVATAAVNVAGSQVALVPGWARFLAFVLLGWAIGEAVTRGTLAELGRSALPLLFIVAALLVVGGALAAIAVAAGWMDSTTAFLAASPGALSQMSALAAAMGANAPLVAAVHTVRVVAIILVAPVVARMVASG
jgi:membrane AbrB-like protein